MIVPPAVLLNTTPPVPEILLVIVGVPLETLVI